jgi:signal transduction histidine kinase
MGIKNKKYCMKVLDKILQLFFTTKPISQACPRLFIWWKTGLRLRLSYDIIKAQGGELTVDTKEGEGTTFQISLTV